MPFIAPRNPGPGPRPRVDADARKAAVTLSLPPFKPAAVNAVLPQEAEGDDVLEHRHVDNVEPKRRHIDSVPAAACPHCGKSLVEVVVKCGKSLVEVW